MLASKIFKCASLAWTFVILSHGVVLAQTNANVTLSTGGDDLRGGNNVFIRLNLVDGSSTREVLLSSGLAGNSRNVVARVAFPETVLHDQIRSITIRHDGSPRSGHPFDTYDNWNLNAVAVQLTDSSFRPIGRQLYNSVSDSRSGIEIGDSLLMRFTGDARTFVLPVRAIGSEPDFTISSIVRGSRGRIQVRVTNFSGRGRGTVLLVACAISGARTSTTARRALDGGGSTVFSVALSPGSLSTVTCVVTGTGPDDTPEFNTSNNRRRMVI